ncbi:Elongator complex protein [Sorochytrium milnesiophthora]
MTTTATSTLDRVSRGKEPAAIVAFIDDLVQSARPLLRDWIVKATSRQLRFQTPAAAKSEKRHVVLVCLEESTAAWQEQLRFREAVRFVDGHSSSTTLQDIAPSIQQAVEKVPSGQAVTIVVDSLNPLLDSASLPSILQTMTAVHRQASSSHTDAQLVLSVSRDVPHLSLFDAADSPLYGSGAVAFTSTPGDRTNAAAETTLRRVAQYVAQHTAYVASVCVQVHCRAQYTREQSVVRDVRASDVLAVMGLSHDDDHASQLALVASVNSDVDAVCVTEVRRRSGKTVREVVLAEYTASEQAIVYRPFTTTAQTPTAATAAADDPAANLSFNLNLTDGQREARAAVVLPYLKAQQQDSGEGGDIHYHPDEGDDFDDEDPDADLDI